MPVKNAGLYLSECLESILNQSYTDWECLMVNDHSEDNSLSILHSFSKRDNRFKVVENVGQGIVDALQSGYRFVTGHFITRMDADDVMTENKLKLMVQVLAEKGRGYVVTGLVKYFSEGRLGEGYKKYAEWLNGLTRGELNFIDIYKECVIPSPCWMVEKSDFEESGGFQGAYPEDYDLCFRFRRKGLKVLAVKEVIHLWRDYSSRTSRTDDHYSDNSFLDLKLKYFIEDDYDEKYSLILWGAGKRGKAIARKLAALKQKFYWVCNNEKKWGHIIEGVKMSPTDSIKNYSQECQVIVSVGMRETRDQIESELNHWGINSNQVFWFV